MFISYLYYCLSQVIFYYTVYYRKILKLDVLEILLNSFLKPVIGIGLCALLTYLALSNFDLQNKYLRVGAIGSVFVIMVIPAVYFGVLNGNDKLFIKGLLFRKKSSGNI